MSRLLVAMSRLAIEMSRLLSTMSSLAIAMGKLVTAMSTMYHCNEQVATLQ